MTWLTTSATRRNAAGVSRSPNSPDRGGGGPVERLSRVLPNGLLAAVGGGATGRAELLLVC